MVRKSIFMLSLLLWPLLMLAQSGTVVVQIEGISPEKGGEISLGIFTDGNFPKVGKQFLGKEIPVKSSTTTEVVFQDVPAGTYAFVAFQDSDADKKLKSNFVGFPIEPIGFSRDAKIKFGPPSFSDAKMELRSGATLSVTIKLK